VVVAVVVAAVAVAVAVAVVVATALAETWRRYRSCRRKPPGRRSVRQRQHGATDSTIESEIQS
jgi:hypothetical protein